jgi:hypothetical protein
MLKLITSKAFFSPQQGFTLRYLTLAGPLISGKSEMPMTLNPGRMVVVVNRRVELIISNNSSRGRLLFKPVLADVLNRFLQNQRNKNESLGLADSRRFIDCRRNKNEQ